MEGDKIKLVKTMCSFCNHMCVNVVHVTFGEI